MHITMVKKRLSSGEPCRKCVQSEQLLRERGLWHRVDEVVWALEGDAASAGNQLAAQHGVEHAPFFLVKNGQELLKVYQSTLQLIRDCMPAASITQAPVFSDADIEGLEARFASASPQEVVTWVLSRYGRNAAIAFSGAEDVVLVDLAVRSGQDFSVFCLDTGRLHPETYRFVEKVRSHYGIEIEMRSPDATALQVFVRKKGLFSFYEDGHKECCSVRKVAPLRAALGQYDAWMTGQRKDQSPATRAQVPIVQWDPGFEGRNGALLKLNPLANWSSAQAWAHIREHGVPYNPLHERGYMSIGCEPCTRPIHPGQHEREGRWWWETETQKECGLHTVPPPAPERTAAPAL